MSRLGFSALMLIVLAACASKPTYEFDYDHNFDFSSFKTYHWYDDMVHTRESEYRKFNPSDKRIREVVGRELARHNLRESSSSEADFWINYSVSKHRQQIVHTTGYDQGMHGSVSAGTYGTGVAVGYSSGPSVREYDEGTAVLDVIEATEGPVDRFHQPARDDVVGISGETRLQRFERLAGAVLTDEYAHPLLEQRGVARPLRHAVLEPCLGLRQTLTAG